MPKVIECVQGSTEWREARCGRITASRMADVLAYMKSGKGEMQCRVSYRMELVAERLTGAPASPYISPEMRWGTEQEPLARTCYEIQNDVLVDIAGFAVHPTMDYSGASPDSLVGFDGGMEIKCPKTTTHIQYMMEGKVPEEYQPQMLWNMVCWERDWWDFVSYDPRMPENLRLFVVRLHYDEQRVVAMEQEVRKLHEECENVIRFLEKRDLVIA